MDFHSAKSANFLDCTLDVYLFLFPAHLCRLNFTVYSVYVNFSLLKKRVTRRYQAVPCFIGLLLFWECSKGAPLFHVSLFSRFYSYLRAASPQICCCASTLSIGLTRLSFMIFASRNFPFSAVFLGNPSPPFCSYFHFLFSTLWLLITSLLLLNSFAAILFHSPPFSCLAFALPTSGLRIRCWDFVFLISLSLVVL